MKVADPNFQTSTQPKAKLLSFEFRNTGMGGFDDSIVLSFRTRKPVKSILRTSRSGNHGTRSYRLFPAKYLLYSVNRSNGGNLYCSVKVIRLHDDGNVETEKEWQVFNREPLLTLDDLPQEIREILEANKEELPLFRQVFPFDYQEDPSEG